METIVVDGGSIDGTAAVAEAAGARVVFAAPGRGTQLAAGAAAATGEWLLFLHADCVLEPGWPAAVGAFMTAADGDHRAGYFDFGLDDPAPGGAAAGAESSPGAAGYWDCPMATRVC